MNRPTCEVADIVRKHAEEYLAQFGASVDQRRVLRAIANCRTAVLGGHVETCSLPRECAPPDPELDEVEAPPSQLCGRGPRQLHERFPFVCDQSSHALPPALDASNHLPWDRCQLPVSDEMQRKATRFQSVRSHSIPIGSSPCGSVQ